MLQSKQTPRTRRKSIFARARKSSCWNRLKVSASNYKVARSLQFDRLKSPAYQISQHWCPNQAKSDLRQDKMAMLSISQTTMMTTQPLQTQQKTTRLMHFWTKHLKHPHRTTMAFQRQLKHRKLTTCTRKTDTNPICYQENQKFSQQCRVVCRQSLSRCRTACTNLRDGNRRQHRISAAQAPHIAMETWIIRLHIDLKIVSL